MNKYIDGWLPEEAIVYALDIKFEDLASLKKWIEVQEDELRDEDEIEHIFGVEGQERADQIISNIGLEKDKEIRNAKRNLELANTLLEALIHETEIAIVNNEYKLAFSEGWDLDDGLELQKPHAKSLIEIYDFNADNDSSNTKLKKRSIATWLYSIGQGRYSHRVDSSSPEEDFIGDIEKFNQELITEQLPSNIIEQQSLKHLFEDDNIPDSLYYAYSLFENVWAKLPDDMNNPTSKDLNSYVQTKQGITTETLRNAIIKVSTPNGVVLGGKRKRGLRVFNIDNLNK